MSEGPFLAFPANQALVDGRTRKYAICAEGEDVSEPGGLACALGAFLTTGPLVMWLVIEISLQYCRFYIFHVANAEVPDIQSVWGMLLLLGLGVPYSVFSLWLAYVGVLAYRDRAAIERRGVLLPGTLISCDVDGNGISYGYSLSPALGMTVKGSVTSDFDDLQGRLYPKPGTPVLIYYLDPERHRML